MNFEYFSGIIIGITLSDFGVLYYYVAIYALVGVLIITLIAGCVIHFGYKLIKGISHNLR